MAPVRIHETPVVQLARLLAESRRRGDPFSVAWEHAVRPGKAVVLASHKDPPTGAVRWPSDSENRRAERTAILETKTAWRRGYERRPATRREAAVGSLRDLLEVLVAASENEVRPPPAPQQQAARPSSDVLESMSAFLRARPYSRASELIAAVRVDGRRVRALLRIHEDQFESVVAGGLRLWTVVEESAQTVRRAA